MYSAQTRQSSRISIHALLAESDTCWMSTTPSRAHFYPRSPCGERRQGGYGFSRIGYISIHALLAESDRVTMDSYLEFVISIHALLAESDKL